jgi:uroporphyrinogen decarboxylase
VTSLERVLAAVGFEETDRTPVIPQVFGHAAVIAGVPLDSYVRDGASIARCQMRALEKYGYDAVFTVMDVNVETEAVGSELQYRAGQYPVISRYRYATDGARDAGSVPDPEKAGRMPEMLKALRILRRELGEQFLIVGCVLGPFTLAAQLMGPEATLYLAIDDPAGLSRLMDFSTEVIIRFGLAQIEAGAHLPIVFDPFASPAVIPYKFFREFELPRLARVFEAFRGAGAAANWLHIAGPASSILPFYPQAGVNIANFDYCVGPQDADSLLSRTCVDGNIKSLSFIEGNPDDIRAEASALIRFFARRKGFILSSGCEIPPESAEENISALVEASRSGG